MNCIFVYCVGGFGLQRVKNLTCFMKEILKRMKVLTKGIFLDIHINHRIRCWQAFAAVFLQMMVLFEGFCTLQ